MMRFITCVWFFTAITAVPAFATEIADSECHLTPVPIVKSVGIAGDVKVNFGEADNASKPAAWQGPLEISTGSAKACTVGDEVSIVEEPVAIGKGVLFVPTYSGSTNVVYAVDVKTCRVIWHSIDFTGPFRYKDLALSLGSHHSIRIGADCRPIDPK